MRQRRKFNIPILMTTVLGGGVTTEQIIQSYGLAAWLDFSDASLLYQDAAKTTPVTANNQRIGYATNKATGATLEFAQSSAAARLYYLVNQINGLPAAVGISTTRLLSTTQVSFDDFSIYLTFIDTGTQGSYERLLDTDYTTGLTLMRNSTAAQFGGGVRESGAPYGRFVAAAQSTPHVIETHRSGTTHTIIVDGVATSGTVSDTATDAEYINILGNAIDATQWGGASVGEVIISLSYHNATQQGVIRSYLAGKWTA